jgi:transposase
VSVLPRTRGEDAVFRAKVACGEVDWQHLYDRRDEEGKLLDVFSTGPPATETAEGYHLVWYHSARKAELDAQARLNRLERAVARLGELRAKLAAPRTRYRDKAKVSAAVEAILQECEVSEWITVEVVQRTTESYRQEKRGRPGNATRYVKHERTRFALEHRIDLAKLDAEARCDGVFPLITNDRALTELEVLLAYKKQPALERRFEQLKTDFVVAPVYLKEASRIQALLCVSFFVLLVESLLERELRRAMERSGVESLPLYPERRACRRPTARRVIDLFEDVQRHTLTSGEGPAMTFTTELTRLQRRVLRLLDIPRAYDR